jgi:hypothetical protein
MTCGIIFTESISVISLAYVYFGFSWDNNDQPVVSSMDALYYQQRYTVRGGNLPALQRSSGTIQNETGCYRDTANSPDEIDPL